MINNLAISPEECQYQDNFSIQWIGGSRLIKIIYSTIIFKWFNIIKAVVMWLKRFIVLGVNFYMNKKPLNTVHVFDLGS